MNIIKRHIARSSDVFRQKFHSQFGFSVADSSFSKFVDYLHEPKDSSSLAVTRILFGIAMLFDIPEERGGATMERRWGDPKTCHFPLLPFLQPAPMPYMALVYAGLWFGALGITLGYKYVYSAATFTACYWYLFLIEKSYWNNHSYLFGLVATLLCFTDAACYWSVDSYKDPSKRSIHVPYWNYFCLKYQFFILYCMAGVQKGTAEWLTGYSVLRLSEHWVFAPFRLFLTVEQTDYLIVHWFVFVFDLTVAMWMMWARSRHVAVLFCACFHLMNTRLFKIGMFPWVCLATMPLFYPFDWPKTLTNKLRKLQNKIRERMVGIKLYNKQNIHEENGKLNDDKKPVNELRFNENDTDSDKLNDNTDDTSRVNDKHVTTIGDKAKEELEEEQRKETEVCDKRERENLKTSCRQRITVYLLIFHVMSQAFLPFSHFLTPGYNNWTNGLYGYSWDMMVHTWDTHSVIVQVKDNINQATLFVDPDIHTPNDRWTRHGDMVHQYARCLKNRLEETRTESSGKHSCVKPTKTKDLDKYPITENDKKYEYSKKINDKKNEGSEKTKDAHFEHSRNKMNSNPRPSSNISIYVDVWCSLNGRFVQRMFDPKVDLLKTEWSPFEKVPFLMPLLEEGLDWRPNLEQLRREVHSWSEKSNVVFLADFPGYDQEKYISRNTTNVTLTVLQGTAAYQPEVSNGQSALLRAGDRTLVHSGFFHRVLNVGPKPVFYMYTFNTIEEEQSYVSKLPVLFELYSRISTMFVFFKTVTRYLVQIFLSPSTCAS